ncbi:MAG: hypothetical protein ABR557_12165 [Pyrinomonadaceae bacterium]
MPETMNYPASGTLIDLSQTCGGDEDGFRGPLTNLTRNVNSSGEKTTTATYEPIPPQQPYKKKTLFFFDITELTGEQIEEIAAQQFAQNHVVVFDNADVYLNDFEAQIAVYREQ